MEKIHNPDSFAQSNDGNEEKIYKEEDSVCVYDRDEMMRARDVSQSSFLPLFFCPQAFRQCAIRNADIAVRSKRRIGPEITGRSVPLVGPLAILNWCDDPNKQEEGDPWELLMSLGKVFDKDCRWIPFLDETYSISVNLRPEYDAFDHFALVSCPMCEFPIRSVRALLIHVTSFDHKSKVAKLGTSVDSKALSFWRNTIDRCFSGPPCRCQVQLPEVKEYQPYEYPGAEARKEAESYVVVVTEEPQTENLEEVEIARELDREEVMRVSEMMGSITSLKLTNIRDIFRPRFFCPKAFRLVASKKSTALHEMNRVCATGCTKGYLGYLTGALAILDRCDDPTKRVKDDAVATLRRLTIFRNSRKCDKVKLITAMSGMGVNLRPNYDEYDHASLSCPLCEVGIRSHWNLLSHVTEPKHITKIAELGTAIDNEAFLIWHKVIWYAVYSDGRPYPH